jgi:hypothetical protein
MKASAASLCFAAALAVHAAAPLAPAPLAAAQLPVGVVFQGDFERALRWTDAEGDNIVVLSSHHDEGDDGANDDVYAVRYTVANGEAKARWNLHDFIHDCPVDHQAAFLKGAAVQVTDLDGDGTAEVWLGYRLMCRGDISSDTMKVIAYQGARKYAMRGETVAVDGKGGGYTFDPAFMEAPKAFRDFARKLWSDHAADDPDAR